MLPTPVDPSISKVARIIVSDSLRFSFRAEGQGLPELENALTYLNSPNSDSLVQTLMHQYCGATTADAGIPSYDPRVGLVNLSHNSLKSALTVELAEEITRLRTAQDSLDLNSWRGMVAEELRPIGPALNLIVDPARVIEALRALGDFPAEEKPNSLARPGHYPAPGENYSLQSAQEWLNSKPDAWANKIIYGYQGFNRYAAHGDGSLSLIESQFEFTNGIKNKSSALLEARILGFWIK